MMDKAARELGIDRIAIRKLNAPDSSGKIGEDRGPLTSAFIKEALETALDIDLQIEGEGSPDKTRFMEIARAQGLRAAITWRDNRFAPPW